MRKYSKIIEKTAKAHGVSPEEVYKEIEIAIEEGMKSEQPSAKAFWDSFPQKPTPDEVIMRISQIVKSDLTTN